MRKAVIFAIAVVGLCTAVEAAPRFLLAKPIYGSSCGYVGKLVDGEGFAEDRISISYRCGAERGTDEYATWKENARIVGKALDVRDDCQIFSFSTGLSDYEYDGETDSRDRLRGDTGRLADTLLLAAEVARRTPDHVPGTLVWSMLSERFLLWQSILVGSVLHDRIPALDPATTRDERDETMRWWHRTFIASVSFSTLSLRDQYRRFEESGLFDWRDLDSRY